MTKKWIQKLGVYVFLYSSLPLLLLMTNPESLPLPLLILPFMLLFAVLYKTSQLFLIYTIKELPKRRINIMAAVFAVFPTVLLLLESVQQLTVRDVAIVLGILIIIIFYLRRIDILGR